jgi:hypothetical protein
VPDSARRTPEHRPSILAKDEARRRAALLSDLRNALAAQGVNSTVVGRYRLVLEGAGTRAAPSGPGDPQLHVFATGGTRVVTTDGCAYLLSGGRACPVDDPDQAARVLCRAAHGEVR